MSTSFFMTTFGSFLLRFRRHLVWSSQLVILVLSYALAFWALYDFRLQPGRWALFALTLPVVVVVKTAVLFFFDLHKGWWRYVGMEDLKDLMKGATVALALLYGLVQAVRFLLGRDWFPEAILVVDYLATIVMLGGIRFAIRAFREGQGIRNTGHFRNVLIIGAREVGVSVCKEMRADLDLKLNPVGFIDDFLPKKGFKIHGVPILGDRTEIPKIIDRYNVDEILIAQPGLSGRELRAFIDQLRSYNVQLKIVPPMRDILADSMSIRHAREVDLTDLLGRESVSLDDEAIRRSIAGRTVFITGAGGSIGSELARQVAGYGPKRLILYERNENNLYYIQLELETRFPDVAVVAEIGDILDRDHVRRNMERHRPALVYHAAAYKHVPMMEANPIQAVKNNVLGTRCVVEEAARCGVETFVHISTDKAVRPMNVMGMTKRVTELLSLGLAGDSATRFMVVRFGNVLGSNGSVLQLFRKQIDEGGPVTVTHPDAMRYFMTIPEAVQLVMQAGTMGAGGDIFVLEMGEQVRILDLALNLIRLSGLEPERDIEILFTGLRPGEKLAEELYASEEGVRETAHDKIKRVSSPTPAAEDLEQALELLERAIGSYKAPEAIRVLWEICYNGSQMTEPGIALEELLADHGVVAPIRSGIAQ